MEVFKGLFGLVRLEMIMFIKAVSSGTEKIVDLL